LRVGVRLGRVCGRKGRALRIGVRLGRVCGRKGRARRALRVRVRLGGAREREGALRAQVRLGRELRARVRVVRGLRGQVRLGRARKRSGKARKSNIASLVIKRSLLRTLAGSLRVLYAENEIRKQTGSGTQDKELNILIKALKY
jgi:hypothetical protein